MARTLKASLMDAIRELSEFSSEELLERRYEKFRRLGVFDESADSDTAPDPDAGSDS